MPKKRAGSDVRVEKVHLPEPTKIPETEGRSLQEEEQFRATGAGRQSVVDLVHVEKSEEGHFLGPPSPYREEQGSR